METKKGAKKRVNIRLAFVRWPETRLRRNDNLLDAFLGNCLPTSSPYQLKSDHISPDGQKKSVIAGLTFRGKEQRAQAPFNKANTTDLMSVIIVSAVIYELNWSGNDSTTAQKVFWGKPWLPRVKNV